jgi:nucleoid DNA-binding protein
MSRNKTKEVLDRTLRHNTHNRWILDTLKLHPGSGAGRANVARKTISAFLGWVRNRIENGEPVRLEGIGIIRATFRKGRTIRSRAGKAGKPFVCTQPDQYVLKIKTCQSLRPKLAELAKLHPDPKKMFKRVTRSL